MLGCKVFLTYKRKRLTGNGHANGNGCNNSLSDSKACTLSTPNLYDELIDKRPSEDETSNSAHTCRDRSFCSCFNKRDSTTSSSVQKLNSLEAEKDVEKLNTAQMTLGSDKDVSKNGIVGLSSSNDCLQNKSCHAQTGSSSSVNADIIGDNGYFEGRLVSCSRGTVTDTTADSVGLKPSFERKSSFESHDTPLRSKTSSLKIANSLDIEKVTVLRSGSEKTKLMGPLITFSRRCKRKRNIDGADTRRKLLLDGSKYSLVTKWSDSACGNTSPCEPANKKSCSLGRTTDFKSPEQVHDTDEMGCQIENKILEVDAACTDATPVPETKILTFEGEEPHDEKRVSKDVLHEAGKVLDRNDQIAIDVQEDMPLNCLEISLNNAVKKASCNEDVMAGKQPEKGKGEEARAILHDSLQPTVGGSHPFLDLTVSPTDSSGTVDCNLDSNYQKQSVHAVSETLWGSLDSTSRSHATVLHETSSPDMESVGKERLEKSISTHHSHQFRVANAFEGEASANCKDHDKTSSPPPLPLDFLSKNKCLQLFSEERTCDSFQSVITQPEVTACIVSEERNYFQFESENNQQKRRSPPFLGLSLPTKPQTTGFASGKCFTTFPFLNIAGETRQLFENTVPQSSSNQLPSLLRHKSVLDGIVSRARALSEKDIFHDKFKAYALAWTEEELDSLWIGVRRYGRANWNAMLRDPRLRFSSLRVAKDLAERWEEEQSKLLKGTIAPQFPHSKSQGLSLGFNSPGSGIWRESMADETRLSLGDVYTHRERNISRRSRFKSVYMRNKDTEYFQGPVNNPSRDPYLVYQGENYEEEPTYCLRKMTMLKNHTSSASDPTSFMAAKGNLPHWLREAVFSSPLGKIEPPPPPAISSISRSQMMHVACPYFDPYEFGGKSHCLDHSLGMRRGTAEPRRASGHVGKPDDVILIDSEASSEETISDDHGARP